MEFKVENNDNVEDEISLPPDTLAILAEFLENKKKQEYIESNQNIFEEDWVKIDFYRFTILLI